MAPTLIPKHINKTFVTIIVAEFGQNCRFKKYFMYRTQNGKVFPFRSNSISDTSYKNRKK